jgi:hypothetical protein
MGASFTEPVDPSNVPRPQGALRAPVLVHRTFVEEGTRIDVAR